MIHQAPKYFCSACGEVPVISKGGICDECLSSDEDMVEDDGFDGEYEDWDDDEI